MKKLSDLKVGDSVYHSAKGELRITRIVYNDYPIETNAGSYTIDGKGLAADANQTIYPYPVKVVPVTYKYRVAYETDDGVYVSPYFYKSIEEFSSVNTFHAAQLIDFTKEEV